MSLVFAVEEAMRHVMCPDKVNIASLGNMVPHIHWHVIPRYQDDAFFPGSAWSKRVQEVKDAVLETRRQKVLELPGVVRAAIARLF
jgi:diadenosine tetraphosphate (Ap4A) HIT family hydrolase